MRTGPDRKLRDQAYREANRDKINSRQKLYDAANKEKRSAWSKKHYLSHKEAYRARYRAWTGRRLELYYGISLAEYNQIFSDQGQVCAICQKAEWNGKAPYVDHDHATGKVRGILCRKCNSAIGFVEDDPAIAASMTKYLRKHESVREILELAQSIVKEG